VTETLLACVDGELLDPEAALIPVTDEGLLRGDGVFEAVRLYDGHPFALDQHMDRMVRSAENLRLPFDRLAVEADVARLLEQARTGDALVRLVATRGGHRLALLEALPELPETLSLGAVTYSPTRVLDGVKSLSYAANMLASRLAQERGHDEALLVTPHGRVLEAPTASFFWVRDGELLTPPLDEHLLDSITRRLIMRVTSAREAITTLDDIAGAEEAFLASSIREVMPVRQVESYALALDGPVTNRTAALVREAIAAELAASSPTSRS
jgi:branched-chain amino acid aminotransferase